MPNYLDLLRDKAHALSNKCHSPTGSKGGQFCSSLVGDISALSPTNQEKTHELINQIPEDVRGILQRAGVKITGHDKVTRGTTGKGLDYGGVYNPRTKEVEVSDRGFEDVPTHEKQGDAHFVLHEFGHAVDYALGNISKTPEFRSIWKDAEPKPGSYFQKSLSGTDPREELLAEAYAQTWSHTTHPDFKMTSYLKQITTELRHNIKTGVTASIDKAEGLTIAAGLAVRAEDTGRVLMLQRSLDETDPAAGKWEFPGGTLDPGETPILAAIREFQEETGHKLPQGVYSAQYLSTNGVYKLFVYTIPQEQDLDINLDHEDRHVLNPDDPDGDNIETLAWWNPQDLKDNPALRQECQDTDWTIFQRTPETIKAELAKRVSATFSAIEEFYNKCHDETTGHFCEDPVTKQQVRIEKASPEEHKASKAKAKAWVRIAKIPSPAEVAKGKANAEKAKQGKSHRTTTEDRGGSAEARRQQRKNLFEEFGGNKRGYVVDHQSGIKMHYTDDPKINPNQYPMFTRGRIFTGIQGGGYTLDNLLPESFETNRKRGSRPIRKENLN